MSFEIDGIEIPLSHQSIRDTWRLLDELVRRRVDGWTERDVVAFLSEVGYKPQTARRFSEAVELRYARLLRQTKKGRSQPKRGPDSDGHQEGEGGEKNA